MNFLYAIITWPGIWQLAVTIRNLICFDVAIPKRYNSHKALLMNDNETADCRLPRIAFATCTSAVVTKWKLSEYYIPCIGTFESRHFSNWGKRDVLKLILKRFILIAQF